VDQLHAVTHPSLPDYLVLTSGRYGTCVTDACPRRSSSADNLFAQMNHALTPVSWKVYAESMATNCALENKGAYAVRHNPPTYYSNLGPPPAGDGSCAANDVPSSRLSADLAAGMLPDFAMVIPNLYNDMHSDRNAPACQLGSRVQNQVCQGDTWLRANLPAILSDGGRDDVTALLVFDEGSSAEGGGGKVALVETGPTTCGGCTDATPWNHYGLANALAAWFGLPAFSPARDNL
jgi:hypothetical protein